MPVRVLITAVVLIVSAGARADLSPRAPWRSEVAAPRAGLPAVAVELGHAGGYVPTRNFPVVLRATAGEAPFDGYLGFHFRVGPNRTADIPVIARAVLRPHETWTFSTFASLRTRTGPLVPRQIAVEWRDASMNVSAVATADGISWTPPQELRPMRIAAAGSPATALGRTAWPVSPAGLSDRAQWYAGFSDVVAPLETWIDLPRRVRDAVVGSAIPIVLFGPPRSNQQLDDLDRALLPVAFEPRPGSYAAPWPYGDSSAIAVPFSWRTKHDTDAVGRGALPYLVKSAVATWVADENGVGRPLPATTVIPMSLQMAKIRSARADPDAVISVAWPRPVLFARAYPALLLTVAAGLAALAGWLLMRRTPRAAIPLLLLLGAALILAARDRIRPQAGLHRVEVETARTPGIVDLVQITRSWGPLPIPAEAEAAHPEAVRTSVTGGDTGVEDAEIRTSNTPMAMGVMRRIDDWHAITRWSRRRILGDAPQIHIRSREDRTLVLDYRSSFPISSVYAEWLCGAEVCWGNVAVPWGTSGRAVIRHGQMSWSPPGGSSPWSIRQASIPEPVESRASSTQITLVQNTRWNTRRVIWRERAGQRRPASFSMFGRDAFALPQQVSPAATALVSIRAMGPSPEVRLTWAAGSTMLAATGREGLAMGTRSYRVPPDVLRQIVDGGGVVHVAVASDAAISTTYIEIWEKKS